MKRKSAVEVPQPTLQEVQGILPKSETIHLRVSTKEKGEIVATASGLHLTITEYLLKCHTVVAAKLRNGS